jgi:sortase B
LAEETIEIVETNNPFFKQFKEKLTEYKKTNPDIYGWIQVDGTNISYPCVKGTDNAYYLDHTATLEKNVNGAIFADYRCFDNILDNRNLVFYGHNMIYPGQMFHELTKFLDPTFFKNNRYVTIYTLDGVYRYEVFAMYQTISTYRYCQLAFANDRLFGEWCAEMKANSLHAIDVGEFTADSKILTLSTCTNGVQTDRYALQAKLVSIEK